MTSGKDVLGIARAQRTTRAIIHEVAASVRPGDRELDVATRIEERLIRKGAKSWLHTPYAWWGERTRFSGFTHWEPDAVPSERRLREGEPFILDAAPILENYPADYAFSGICEPSESQGLEHERLKQTLGEIKALLPDWVGAATSGDEIYERVGREMHRREVEPIHPLYPGNVLGHLVGEVPSVFQKLPRVGKGLQLSLLVPYAFAMTAHHVLGRPYPLLNPTTKQRLEGIYAVEPHLASGDMGVKFESMLFVEEGKARWLDPELFGEVAG